MPFLVWQKEVMDAGRTADMSVLSQSHGCWLHQRLEELQKQAGLWHWSASSPHLPHELELLDYMSREPRRMGLKFPVVQIWSLPKAYPDVDSKSRVRGCRWRKRQMLASWTGILWEAVAEVSGAEWMVRGKVSGMCSCRPESLCWSLFKIAS